MMQDIQVIALDLEGTSISNAVSQFARPGLFEFLDFCYARFPRVVLFTTVPEANALAIVRLLVEEGEAPLEFQERFEYVRWEGALKDLSFIPGVTPDQALLLDDQERVVRPDQRDRWVAIREFDHPYPTNDTELARVRAELGKHRGDE